MTDNNFIIGSHTKDIDVFNSTKEAIIPFESLETKRLQKKASPSEVECVYMKDISVYDPINDSLNAEYPMRKDWWERKSREGRKAFVSFNDDNTLAALLILKLENEEINSVPDLPNKKRLKISTLKVSREGYGIGSQLIKKSIEEGIKNNVDEIYLTHYTKEVDRLVKLIIKYGFEKVAVIKNEGKEDEDIYVKTINNII